MHLQFLSYILLPVHLTINADGFDHASISQKLNRLYIAHTANDTIDVVDTEKDKFLSSHKGFKAIAGALVSDEKELIFTSNRGDNTVGVVSSKSEKEVAKITVGNGPNGLAYDSVSNLLLAGNTGSSPTISLIDIAKKKMIANLPVPSRTRWSIFDPSTNNFFVNVKEPAQLAVINASTPTKISTLIPLPEKGPHGLDIDPKSGRLFVACDSKKLVVVDSKTHKILSQHELSGAPDVIFFNSSLNHLYVTIEDPGVVDVFDTNTMKRIEILKTEEGAHTMAFHPQTNKVYVLLPKSHRAAVYQDSLNKM